MMRLIQIVCLLWLCPGLGAQEAFRLSHGPYLQEPSCTGITVAFATSEPSFSRVEVFRPEEAPKAYYTTRHGLNEAGGTRYAVRVDGLEPGTKYYYRIGSKQIVRFDPYSVVWGDSIVSRWTPFRTPDQSGRRMSFLVMSDLHGDTVRLRKLLNFGDYNSCDAVFYVGDMVNYIDTPDDLYRGFIDASTRIFASRIPFIAVRGNHETRGASARRYTEVIPKRSGTIYGTCRFGDVVFVLLDGGEDKPDGQSVYGGLAGFDRYRSEQAGWFRAVMADTLYRSARYRIVLSHYGTVFSSCGERWSSRSQHGAVDLNRKLLPLLNRAEVDLMISGHTHRFAWHPPANRANRFPVLVGSNRSAARIDIADGLIRIRVFDDDGRVLFTRTLQAGDEAEP